MLLIILLTLPAAYLLFYLGHPPYFITVVSIGISFLVRMTRSLILSNLVNEFRMKNDFKKILLPVIVVTIVVLPQYYLRQYFGDNIYSILGFSAISVIWILLAIYFFGFNGNERSILKIYTVRIIEKVRIRL